MGYRGAGIVQGKKATRQVHVCRSSGVIQGYNGCRRRTDMLEYKRGTGVHEYYRSSSLLHGYRCSTELHVYRSSKGIQGYISTDVQCVHDKLSGTHVQVFWSCVWIYGYRKSTGVHGYSS
jgi:hypothetical protein